MRGPEPRPEIAALPLYVPGATRGTGKEPVIKLSSNESALGPSPEALRAYREYAETLRLYPDTCLLYTSPSPRDLSTSRMPSSA